MERSPHCWPMSTRVRGDVEIRGGEEEATCGRWVKGRKATDVNARSQSKSSFRLSAGARWRWLLWWLWWLAGGSLAVHVVVAGGGVLGEAVAVVLGVALGVGVAEAGVASSGRRLAEVRRPEVWGVLVVRIAGRGRVMLRWVRVAGRAAGEARGALLGRRVVEGVVPLVVLLLVWLWRLLLPWLLPRTAVKIMMPPDGHGGSSPRGRRRRPAAQ
mmetsp:Transcript_1847/g.5525  ORF Transcript_1847/g.5525 Transcript_1847/m.5525 type:complete len:214 (+) Transcript_1847:226-867(+)